jgi:spermidine/putrescine transport system permease protein
VERAVRADLPGIGRHGGRVRRALAPYLLILPGGAWLVVFFLIPIAVTAFISLETGDIFSGFQFDWSFGNYSQALSEYQDIFIRSLEYGLIATAATLAISYPMAYWIAFHGGRYKSVFLFLLLLPFFVSFVIRTVSWEFILADQGFLFGPLKQIHVLPQDFHVLATSFAVIAGLTYNFLPFMALPLYVSLEKIDRSVLAAAQDLYANQRQTFLRVIVPLSIPGIFAGFLLTFVPATSDFVNATILGGTNSTMIGNVIQTEFLTNNNYPAASALSFILMAALLIGVFIYARALGTSDITGVAAQ